MLCPLFSHATYLKYMIWTCFNIWNCTPSGVLSKDSEASPCWDKPGFQTNQDLGMGETWWNDVWVPKGPTVHIFSIFWPIVTTHYCQQWTDLPRKHLVVDPCLQYHACRGMNIYHQKKNGCENKKSMGFDPRPVACFPLQFHGETHFQYNSSRLLQHSFLCLQWRLPHLASQGADQQTGMPKSGENFPKQYHYFGGNPFELIVKICWSGVGADDLQIGWAEIICRKAPWFQTNANERHPAKHGCLWGARRIDADWLSALNYDGFMFLEGLGAALLLPGVLPVAHGHDANFTCRGVET